MGLGGALRSAAVVLLEDSATLELVDASAADHKEAASIILQGQAAFFGSEWLWLMGSC